MASGVTTVDGLISGLDTTSIIESMAAIRRKPIETATARIAEEQAALQSYQSLQTQVLALQATATTLADGKSFGARTVSVSDQSVILASAAPGASLGTHEIEVISLATVNRLASGAVADADAALGFEGSILLNNHAICLQADDDLYAFRDAINAAGAGVSASILRVSATEQRLVITGLKTGVENTITLADANSTGFLQGLGLLSAAASTSHPLTDGLASDTIRSRLESVASARGLSSPPSGTITINGVDITVDLAVDSLQDLATRLNGCGAGVTATAAAVTTGGVTGYRLEVTGATTPVLGGDSGVLQALGLQRLQTAGELQAAADAVITVDGFEVRRGANQIDDALEGLSLDLLQAAPGETIGLSVTSNVSAAVDSLAALVTAYNNIVTAINSGLQFDQDTAQGGVFFGDGTVASIQTGLFDAVMDVVSPGAAMSLPSQLGLSVDQDGLLSLDATKLRRAMEDNPDGVIGLLTTRGRSSNAAVEFSGATADTLGSGSGGYAIAITTAATRARAQSEVLATGIQQNETLTIEGRYTVSLLAGESLQQAADKLNTVFSDAGLGYEAAVNEGRLQVQSRFYGSYYHLRIASSLADGAGGTGLGGAKAGAEAVYAGTDVQGTIGGKAATGWGQWLTGSEGSSKGLKLKIDGDISGDLGTVTVERGVASRLAAYAARLTAPTTGGLTYATKAVSDTITSLQDDVKTMTAGVDRYVQTLRERFATVEGLLARNTSTMDYLTSQLASWKKSSSD